MMRLSSQDSGSERKVEEQVCEDGVGGPVNGMLLMEGLPDSVALQCLARVPVHCFSALRGVSRAWRSALLSPDFSRTRKLAGVEEEWLFVSAYDPDKVWQAYDPIRDRWSILPVLPSRIKHLTNFGTASVEGKLYVLGGGSDEVDPQTGDRDETIATNEVWRFDPVTSKWEQRAPMITSRSQFACCVLDGQIVAAGGFTNTRKALALVEMYDPLRDKWELMPELGQVHNAACSGVLFEGKVHVVHKGAPVAQVYDTEKKRWIDADCEWAWGKMAVVKNELYVVRHGVATREQRHPASSRHHQLLSSWPGCLHRISFGVIGLGSDLYVVGGIISPRPNVPDLQVLNDVDICDVGSENPVWRKGASMTVSRGSVLGCAVVKL